MTVHVFARRMDNDVSAEFDRTAEYRGGKGVVDDKRQIVTVCDICKALDIEYGERGVCDRLTEEQLRVRLYRCLLYTSYFAQ